jgi:hypothetical protein
MKAIKLAVVTMVVTMVGSLGASDRPRSIIHVSHLTTTEIGVTCVNGADPTGSKIDDVLIISCRKDN